MVGCLPAAKEPWTEGVSTPCELGTGAPWSWGSVQAGAAAGSAMAVGDLDGDGFGDLVVGAPGDPRDRSVVPRVMIFRGSGGELGDLPDVVLEGEQGSGFGRALAIGDLDGDGRAELAVGSPTAAADAGEIGLFTGLPGASEPVARLPAGEPGSLGGWSLVAADLDGDGADELIVGAPAAGSLRVVEFGPGLQVRGSRDIAPDAPMGSRFGHSLGVAGDADGDGLADVGVGAPQLRADDGQTGGGVFLLSSTGLRLLHRSEGVRDSRLGWSIDGGDLDGDGLGDLVAGAPREGPQAGSNQGRLVVLTGLGAASPTVRELDAPVRDLLGGAVAIADVDGDGAPELAAGWGDPVRSFYPPGVVLFRGGAGGFEADAGSVTEGPQRGLGATLASGNVDDDAAVELFMADPAADCRARGGGAVLRWSPTR